MQTYNTHYEYHLGRLLGEAIAAQKDAIASGGMTLEGYKFACGVIQGLQQTFDLMAEADRATRGINKEDQ